MWQITVDERGARLVQGAKWALIVGILMVIFGVLGAVGLQVGVPTPYVVLHRFGVEGDDVLDDAGGFGTREPGAGGDPLDQLRIR